jgi:hypothetical protein
MIQQLTPPEQGGHDIAHRLDLLWGVDAIAKELGLTRRQAYHQLESGRLPARKQSGKWCASRRGLQRFFADLTDGKLAA